MALRYDKKLNQEINRTIKNFNQKISRLMKDERELLPDKINKKELLENVNTRTELNRKLKELQRFSNRGAEEIIETRTGIRLTQYQLTNLKKESARIKRNLTNQIKKLESEVPKVFGKKQSATFKEMGDPEYLNLLARRQALNKNINLLNKDEFERYRKLLLKTGQNQEYMNNIFKENYIKMLTDLGYYFNYDNEKLDILKQKLRNLKPNQFLTIFRDDKAIRAILDYYPIVTDSFAAINPDDIAEDVITLYDNLIENIEEII